MPRVHFVKSARKDNPVAKKGESYYWWKPRIGGRGAGKRYSKDYPKPSQTTTSEFMSRVYAAQESLAVCEDAEAMKAVAEEIRELGQEQSDKLDNMPDGLREGDTGQLLEERASQCEEWADAIEAAADGIEDDDSDEDEDVDDEEGLEDESEENDSLAAARDEAEQACPF